MSLTLSEARARAAVLEDVAYDVDLVLAADAQTFESTSSIRFTCTQAGETTFLELADGAEVVMTLNGQRLAPEAYDGRRITLADLPVANEVRVSARLPYVTNGDGMHRFVDPVDGETYVSAYCGMDNTQRVFACFDQPDLKAPIALSVSADERWTVLATGRRLAPLTPGRWRFAATPPIPTYSFVICAGPWQSTVFEHAGGSFGWHARRSLAAELERDAAELRQVTIACWDHYAATFDEPYPFADYHQVFVPGLNWGAQENPGCVTYRDELLPAGRISDQMRQRRAIVIAHEMAHMWFGNLVTMRWFDDAWLSESFADYMGFAVADRAAGFADTWVDFDATYLPMAYDADGRRSTHPVAPDTEDLVDVDTAYGNFDSLSYAKGNAVVRQLVTWLGEADFLAGVNTYLTRHRFATASLVDFVAALSEASGRDVARWVKVWLRSTGFDTLVVTREAGVPVLSRTGSRPHRLRVTSYDLVDGALRPAGTRTVDLGEDPVTIPEGRDRVVVANSHGDTFARLRLDDQSLAAVKTGLATVPDPTTRAVLWTALGDLVQRAELDPSDYLDLVDGHLPSEGHGSVFEAVLDRARCDVVAQYVPAHRVGAAVDLIAAVCRRTLDRSAAAPIALAAVRGLAATSRDTALLGSWLAEDRTHTGMALDPRLRWEVLLRLAETGAAGAPGLVEAERRRDPSMTGQLGAARASAALPDPAAKTAAWDAMFGGEPSNRLFAATAEGFWSAEQHELLAPYVGRYLDQAPALAARRGQAFSLIVGHAFPTISLGAAGLSLLDAALDGDVPTVLRRTWEDRRDDLALAVAAQRRFG